MGLIEAYEKARAAGVLLASTRRLDPIGDLAPRTGGRERFPEIVAWLKNAEPLIARMRSDLRRMIRTSDGDPARGDAESLRKLIAMLDDEEIKLAKFWRANKQFFTAGRKALRRREPDSLAAFERLAARFDEALLPLLEATRDTRWQIMCELAERQRGDEGPAFDDPKALRRHLMGLVGR